LEGKARQFITTLALYPCAVVTSPTGSQLNSGNAWSKSNDCFNPNSLNLPPGSIVPVAKTGCEIEYSIADLLIC